MEKLGRNMRSTAPYSMAESPAKEKIYPTLTLDMDVLDGQDDLEIDDNCTLTFKAKVTSIHKDEYSQHVGYSLVSGELEPKTYKQKSESGVEKLRAGIKKVRIVMPAGV